ncbi:MAG: protein YgfX [Gammaproteobacteria bacterium]
MIGSLASGLPTAIRAAFALAILASWYFYAQRLRHEQGDNRPLILYGEQEGWTFRIGDGPMVHATLLPSSVATRWLVVLHFKTEKNRFQSFVLFADTLDAEDYRRLRMILTITGGKHR